MAHQLRLTLSFDVLESISELTSAEQHLMLAAQEAAQQAYAPYSGFLVGAALLMNDGSVHTGNNQENAAYPSGLCAERTALFGLSALHPNKIINVLAVTARPRTSPEFTGAPPCGACRQVMAEYETRQQSPIRIIIQVGPTTFYRCASVSDLLPLQFSPASLKLPA